MCSMFCNTGRVHAKLSESHGLTTGLGSAGFHHTRAQLDGMEDPEEAHAKRGAHWTFNGPAFVQAIRDLKKAGEPSHSQTRRPRFE